VRPEPTGVVQVTARGKLDAATDELARALDSAVAGGADHLVVDLLDVTFIDSSVVRDLVLAHRAVSERGGWLRIVYTHHLITRVIEICGLSEIFPQYPTVAAAISRTPHHPDVEVGGSTRGGAS
jgi:stage II sporulation protein AA (anti-sigma F factor antagonist)